MCRGDFYLHQATGGVQPEMYGLAAFAGYDNVTEPCRITIQRRRTDSMILHLDCLAPERPRIIAVRPVDPVVAIQPRR